MKTLCKAASLFLLLFVLFAVPYQRTIARQEPVSPTPTYDPLEEPALPPNPTEYELGRNLYWHWCMTCHGDRGQGLTDEFRGIWEPEHQNCWGRGCHVGRQGDEAFPIPTVVPAVVNERQLEQFASLQELADFLRATHPPQSPGVLKDDEYHAIALFVFTMNGRSLSDTSLVNTPAPGATRTMIPLEEPARVPLSRTIPIAVSVLVLIIAAVLIKNRGQVDS